MLELWSIGMDNSFTLQITSEAEKQMTKYQNQDAIDAEYQKAINLAFQEGIQSERRRILEIIDKQGKGWIPSLKALRDAVAGKE